MEERVLKKIVGLVGTNSKISTNRMLLEYIEAQFFYKVQLDIVEIKDVPLIDYRIGDEIPEVVQDIKKRIDAAEGVIIAAPEYDHSPTAALLNTLAWLSYKIHPLSNKPVMIVGAGHGVLGASRAQNILRQILTAPEINARVMSTEYLLGYSQKAFDEIGDLRSREKIIEMEYKFDEFLEFIDVVTATKQNLVNIHDFDNFKWDSIERD